MSKDIHSDDEEEQYDPANIKRKGQGPKIKVNKNNSIYSSLTAQDTSSGYQLLNTKNEVIFIILKQVELFLHLQEQELLILLILLL